MGKLYGLLVQAPLQEKPVQDHCFGDCGRISMGGAIMTGAGARMMCCHDECPHLGEQTDAPIGTSAMTGEPIYLRALEPMPQNDRVEGRDAALSRRVPSHDGLASTENK